LDSGSLPSLNLHEFYRLSLLLTGEKERAEELLVGTLVDGGDRLEEIRDPVHRSVWLASRLRQGALRYGPLEPVQPRLLREGEGAAGVLQIEAYILVRRFQMLPEPERMALALFYLQMFSMEQIAELLEMTLEKLARTLESARLALKAAVEDAGAPASVV